MTAPLNLEFNGSTPMLSNNYYNFQKYIDVVRLLYPDLKYTISEAMKERGVDFDDNFEVQIQLLDIIKQIDHLPFLLTDEQVNQLKYVDVGEYEEMRLPFDAMCIELGDSGSNFFEEKLQDQNLLETKALFIHKFGKKMYVFSVGGEQLTELKALAKGELGIMTTKVLYNYGFNIAVDDIEGSIARAKEDYIQIGNFVGVDKNKVSNAFDVLMRNQVHFIYAFCKFLEAENISIDREKIVLPPTKFRKRHSMVSSVEVLVPKIILTKHQQSLISHYVAGEGTTHSYQYDVRGHFRHLKPNKSIWIPPHRRGLSNTAYRPTIRKL